MRDFEDVEIIGMLRSYVNATLKGMGAIKGSCVSIASITRNQEDTANVVTFSWEDNTGVTHTSTMTVPDGLSAYQVAVKNGFSGTEQEWLDSLHGDGGSYDDTEIKAEINDVWKVQGELGAKNLLTYPYKYYTGGYNGVIFTAQSDGSFVCNGASSGYSHMALYAVGWGFLNLPIGKYCLTISADNPSDIQNGYVGMMFRFTDNSVTPSIVKDYAVNTSSPKVFFDLTQEMLDKLENGSMTLEIRIYSNAGVTCNNVIVRPMLRLASDTDDTWQPYAATNKELTYKQNELAAIAGEYLVAYNGGTSKKRVVRVGATECFFYYGGFADKYGITSDSDLNFDISAETASGNVVAYNQIVLNATTKSVYIRFDELTEQTTFVCKCSKIQ